jgi:hypothetical protein
MQLGFIYYHLVMRYWGIWEVLLLVLLAWGGVFYLGWRFLRVDSAGVAAGAGEVEKAK